MRAFISGQAGAAVLVDTDEYRCVHIHSLDVDRSLSRAEASAILDGAADLVEREGLTRAAIKAELTELWSKDRALQLVLILLDSTEEAATRREAAAAADDLLAAASVAEFVANRMYSAALPASADPDSALGFSTQQNCRLSARLLAALREDQDEIERRVIAWNDLPDSLFASESERRSITKDCVEAGAVRLFVTSREKSDWALFQLLAHPSLRGKAVARAALMAWAAPFKESIAGERFSKAEMYSEEQNDDESTGLRPGRSTPSSHAAFVQAGKQRRAIKQHLRVGDTDTVVRYTNDLIRQQRLTSEPEHLAKSLCDLAQFAKQVGSAELHQHFARLAVAEAPEDGWSYAVLADSYRSLSHYQAALDAYYKAGAFGQDRIARTGRAEVLKDLGQLSEALTIYNECALTYPTDRVVLNGRAAMLASFGKLPEALTSYETLLSAIDYDPITLSGRAQVLREMGRLDESLAAFTQVARDFPDDIIPQHARGGVLRELGRYAEAEENFTVLAERFPLSPSALTGLARVYRDQGMFDEALAEYRRAVERFALHPAARVGIADTFRRTWKLSEATKAYRQVIQEYPRSASGRLGLAATLAALGEYSEALALLPSHAPASFTEWVAYHIRGMVALKRGDLETASDVLTRGAKEVPWASQRPYFQTALATLHLAKQEYGPALAVLENVRYAPIEPIRGMLRLHVYERTGRTSEAKRTLDILGNIRWPVVARVCEELASGADRSGQRFKWDDAGLSLLECDAILLAA